MKHNKKRNTAFLYESLVKELTKAIVRKDNKRKKAIIGIIKESFYKSSPLKKELELYVSIIENEHKMTKDFSLRFINEVKIDFLKLDRKEVFNSQTKLIESINKNLSTLVYQNFIPNYKNIATVGQWFNSAELDAKSRLLIETKVLQVLVPKDVDPENMKHIDNLTYKTFINKFNTTYNRSLKESQKSLLTNYIVSFSDNGLGLKTFMNEEVGRLISQIEAILESKNNSIYTENTEKVLKKLKSFKENPINESMVKDLFYIQDLIEEIKDGN